MNSAMQLLLVLFQVLSVLAAAVLSRALMLLLLRHVRRGGRPTPHPLETPLASALVFGAIFAAVWLLLSTVVVLVWFAVWHRCSRTAGCLTPSGFSPAAPGIRDSANQPSHDDGVFSIVLCRMLREKAFFVRVPLPPSRYICVCEYANAGAIRWPLPLRQMYSLVRVAPHSVCACKVSQRVNSSCKEALKGALVSRGLMRM